MFEVDGMVMFSGLDDRCIWMRQSDAAMLAEWLMEKFGHLDWRRSKS